MIPILAWFVAKSKQSRILQEHMNKDDRDLSRIIDLLGVEMTRDGKSSTNSR